ncbi:unnamed protein product, partial [Staurois parvus]
GLGQQVATYHWAGASGNRRQPTTGQGPRATGGNLPLGRGLGQQAAIYPWAGVLGNRRQSTTGQGTQRDSSWAPQVAILRACHQDTGGQCTHSGAVRNTGGRCTQQGQFRTQVVVCTPGTVQDTGGRCTQRGQFRTRVVGAHNRDSSGHGWSVHTAGNSSGHGWSVHTTGTVQDTGGRCTQRG